MAKKRTVNVDEIWNIKGTAFASAKSVLTFESSNHKINLHLGAYNIGNIADVLWEIVKERPRRVCRDQTPSRYELIEDMPTIPYGKLYSGWIKDIDGEGHLLPT